MSFDYSSYRKDRLIDLVDDYLNDSDTTAETFVSDILDEVKSLMDYHESQLQKASTAYLKLQGLAK